MDGIYKNAETLFAEIERTRRVRAELMPDEEVALKIMFAAYQRLKELGFKEAIYCPKDGSLFEAIEAGCTGIGICSYDGEWPTGRWWMHSAGDLWPSRPILFRLLQENPNGS